MNNIEKQLVLINEKLQKPFPYGDTDRIQEEYSNAFSKLSDDDNCLTADFNTYCMNIAGTLSYVLKGKSNKIPKGQIEMLRLSFFEFFKPYKFFEDDITQYEGFYQEYLNFEEAKKLLLQYLATYRK